MNSFSKIISSFVSLIVLNFSKISNQINKKPMGVKTDLFMILETLAEQPAKIHDIKLKINNEQLHAKLLGQGYNAHSRNGCIIIKNIPLTDNNLNVKMLVYPKTIQVDIGCSLRPIIYNSESFWHLHEILTELSQWITSQSGVKLVPVKDWIFTHFHLNVDGTEIDGERFHITVGNASGGFYRYYSKLLPDGTVIPRVETIVTPHRTLEDEISSLLEMEHG